MPIIVARREQSYADRSRVPKDSGRDGTKDEIPTHRDKFPKSGKSEAKMARFRV